MCGCDWDREKTLREQLLCRLGQMTVVLFAAMVLAAGLFVGLTLQSTAQRTEKLREDQVVVAMKEVVRDGVSTLSQKLEQLSSHVQLLSGVRSEQTRSDYPYSPDFHAVNNYMDAPELVLPFEREFDVRYGNGSIPITRRRSSYRVPNKRPSDLPTFSAALNRSIGTHYVMDNVICFLLRHTGVSSMYSGTLQFRLYLECPGVGTNTYAYDFYPEEWAQQSIVDPDTLIVSDPELDTYVGQMVMSVTKGCRNISSPGNNGPVASVAAADINIAKDLAASVANVQFRNVSNSALFVASTQAIIVSDGRNFVLPSAAIVENAAEADATEAYLVEDDPKYYYASQRLSVGDLVLVTRVPKSYVDDFVAEEQRRNSENAVLVIIAFVFTVIPGLLLVCLILWYCVKRATDNIQVLQTAIEEIPLRHVGRASVLEGTQKVPPPNLPEMTVEEETELAKAVTNAVEIFNHSRTAIDRLPLNPYFQKPQIAAVPMTVYSQPISVPPLPNTADHKSDPSPAFAAVVATAPPPPYSQN